MIDTLPRSTKAKPETAIRKLVIEPLESVLGQALFSVSYWLLNYGWDSILVEQPNELGLLFIRLHFENTALEVSWGFEKSLRGDDLAYHVQVLPADQAYRITAENAGNYCEVADVNALPWQEAIGRKLTGVEVIGLQRSPQALRLSFADTDVVIAIGYSGSDLLVGDGDDILVFSGQKWESQKSSYGLEWESLWRASVESNNGSRMSKTS